MPLWSNSFELFLNKPSSVDIMVSNPRLWNHIFSKSENFKNAFFANPDSRLETVSIIIALSISREGGEKVIWGQLEFLTARNFSQLIFIYLKFIFLLLYWFESFLAECLFLFYLKCNASMFPLHFNQSLQPKIRSL